MSPPLTNLQIRRMREAALAGVPSGTIATNEDRDPETVRRHCGDILRARRVALQQRRAQDQAFTAAALAERDIRRERARALAEAGWRAEDIAEAVGLSIAVVHQAARGRFRLQACRPGFYAARRQAVAMAAAAKRAEARA